MSSYTFSSTESRAFTLTHAKHLAAKVATDLKRIQRLYGAPSDQQILMYEQEATALLKAGYLGTLTLGFQKGDKWVEPTLSYTASDLQNSSVGDDDPGRIRAGADVTGAYFCSYLIYSSAWDALTLAERSVFEQSLPFSRSGRPDPSFDGYLVHDRTYSSGGRALNRSSVRNY